MKNVCEFTVSYCDTDAYQVVWHGNYLRWLERARMSFCDELGLNLAVLQNENILLPLVNLNVRYKRSAKLGDKILVETSLKEYSRVKMVFEQKVVSKETGKTFVEAEVTVSPVDGEGKLYRNMPDVLKSMCEQCCEEK